MRLRTLLLGTIVPVLGILAAPVLGQGDSTVTALTNGAPADGSEVFYVVRTSASAPKARKLDIDDVSAYVASVTGLGDLLGIDLTGLGDGDCLLYDLGTETWLPGSCGGGGGAGTVTSVAATFPSFLSVSGSPITTSGTLAVSLATQTANTVFAGPTTGSAAAPAFRSLVSADIPNNAADTTGNASTASALAANGANCAAGQAAAGVDASGAAEGCAAYLTDITGESIADLSDVTALSGNTSTVATTSGTLTSGDCVEFDASGNLVASGGACGGGSPTFADIATGTNTSAAMVVGAGASLNYTSTGTITAYQIGQTSGDYVRSDGSYVSFGNTVHLDSWQSTGGFRINQDRLYLAFSNTGGRSSSFTALGLSLNSLGEIRITGGTDYYSTGGIRIRRTGTEVATIDDGAGGAADLTVTGDVTVGDDLNLTSDGGLARLGAMSGALPTCDAATARAVVFDQTGDLCACPPDGSDWYDVSDGLGTAGDCA